jgi:hypothetical protein
VLFPEQGSNHATPNLVTKFRVRTPLKQKTQKKIQELAESRFQQRARVRLKNAKIVLDDESPDEREKCQRQQQQVQETEREALKCVCVTELLTTEPRERWYQ